MATKVVKKPASTKRKGGAKKATATGTKKTATTKKSAKTQHPTDVVVNIKLEGEKTMRKGVTLKSVGGERYSILSGTRGRPKQVDGSEIQKVTVVRGAK